MKVLEFEIKFPARTRMVGCKLCGNLRQVVHTYVRLSPSSITWYCSRCYVAEHKWISSSLLWIFSCLSLLGTLWRRCTI